jgi:glycosyltransferase involved in cell wall biosynthesis
VTASSIVQVTLWNSPYLGNFMSSELALAHHVRAQLRLGTHCVLAPGAEGQPWLEDLEAAGITWSILPPRRSAWRAHLDGVIREHAGALIHTHFTKADLPAASAARAAGVPCIWHIRTGFNGYPVRRRLTDLFKMRLVARRRVARILVVAPWLGELARRRGVPADRIELMPNAIVVERFARPPDRAAARERFDLDPDADVVLLLGWWPDVKGVDLLIDAVQQIVEGRPKLQALLVGEEQMRTFLAERLPERTPWLRTTGFVNDPAWLYAAADIFVSASRHEGQSGAAGEALACGLPVVMSDIPGHYLWRAAPNVLTFPTEDADALAARLEQLLDTSPGERIAAGVENRDWARCRFGIDAWCERSCELYRQLL